MRQNEGSIIFSSLRDTEKEEKKLMGIPEGYVEIKLSTKGLLGAPAVVHVRNFKVRDIVALSVTKDQDLPSRLITILNEMIYEDTDVGTWHEKEIEELMVYIFITFYKTVLEDVEFPLLPEDFEFIAAQPDGENMIQAIKDGKYKPRTIIDIPAAVDTYDIPDDFRKDITITNNKTGFHVTFGHVRYCDQLIVKKWLDSYYKDDAKRFQKIEAAMAYNSEVFNQMRKTVDALDKVDILDDIKMIEIDPDEQEAYNDYMTAKLQTLSEVVRLVSVVDYNGTDVRNMSLGDKYELMANDPRIDFGMISKLSKRQDKFKFGIKPEVRMMNPITGQSCLREFPFRLITILQAIQVSGDSDYDDGYGDEDQSE